MSAGDLWTVSYTVAAIAAGVTIAGLIAVRLLAARSVATNLTVIAAASVVATLTGVAATADEMFIARADVDVVIMIVGIAGVAGFAVALLVGRRVSRSSRLLLGAVQEVGRSGGYTPPDARLPAELAGLSDGLAGAHQRLAEARDRERALEASRRELVAWVSHDLRTPLAGLRAMAEALEDGVVTDRATVSRYHAQIRKETDRLTVMIDDLFELSRIHAGALRLRLRPAPLGDLIGEALTSAEPLARARGVQLRGYAAASPPVLVDTAEAGRALRNLVTNAIRHTPPAGTVEILGDESSGMARISVSDSCGGIPAEHLPRVFDVAFRGQPARTPGPDEGAGLGLSIARGIVEAHLGRIAVRNVGPGCQFAIWLPVAPGGAGRTAPQTAQPRRPAAAAGARSRA